MKHILPFLFFLCLNISLAAQIELSATEVTVEEAVDLTDEFTRITAHLNMTNTSTSEVSLKWVLTRIDAPAEWTAQLCDANSCFPYGAPTNVNVAAGLEEPVLLMPDSASILDVSVRPNGVAGTGTYKAEISLTSDPTTILATGTYTFTLSQLVTATEDFKKADVKIFPNPTTSFFQITENEHVSQIEIFNIVGKRMMTDEFVNGRSFDISSFPNGLYLVRMVDEEGKILKTSRMTKR